MLYDAFISYSHTADGEFAPAVQRALHAFAKPWWKLRAARVFRDDTNLAAAHDLTHSITQAIEASHFFILLASPGAALSKWVEREVRLWLASKPPENILIVLTQGAIAWNDASDFDWAVTDALPRALAGVFKSEPLWVDLSFARSDDQLSMCDPRFQQAIARLAARLHGKSLDDIAGEEVRAHRKTRRIAQAAFLAIGSLAVAAIAGGWLAREGQRRAEHNLAQALVAIDSVETAVAKDLQDLTGVPVALKVKMLKGVETILTDLEAAGEAATVRGTRAVVLSEFAAAFGVLGQYEEATSRIRDAIDILSDQAKARPTDITVLAALAKSRKVHGDLLWWQRKDLPLAVDELQSSTDTYITLAQRHPAHRDADDWKLSEMRALIGLGDIHFDRATNPSAICSPRAACLAVAKSYFQRAQELALSVQNQDDNNFRWKNGALVSRERVAKVYAALDDLARAGAVYAELVQEYQRMADLQPNNTKWQQNVVALYARVGGIDLKTCRADAALENYGKALDLARKMHQLDPERIDWSHELSSSLKHTAEAHEALAQFAAAETDYRASLSITRDLVGKQPANADLKADLQQIETALGELGVTRSLCVAASNQ
jgi:tetratricopeptide (TPR) repeat protein